MPLVYADSSDLDDGSEQAIPTGLDYTPERQSSYTLQVPKTPDRSTPRYRDDPTISPTIDAVNRRVEHQANAIPGGVPQADEDAVPSIAQQVEATAAGSPNQIDAAHDGIPPVDAMDIGNWPTTPHGSGEGGVDERTSFQDRLFAHRPDLRHIHNLADLILVPSMPASPPVYAKTKLTGTKASSKREQKMYGTTSLERIVYVPALVEQLRDRVVKLLEKIPVDLSNPTHVEFIHRVHPAYTSRDLPPVIYSEHDSEDWVMAVLCRPVLAILQALQGGQIPSEPPGRTPFLASAPGGADRVIADGRFVAKGTYPKEKVRGCLEIKAPSVIPLVKSPLQRLQTAHVTRPASAVKFNWPTTDTCSKATKIIMQLWAQSVVEDTRFCILSSYESTTFAYRGADDRTLYVSPAYAIHGAPILQIICWMLLAFESIPGLTVPEVPTPDATWWDAAINKNKEPGICTATLPPE